MSSFEQFYLKMNDGTIKQKNPFTGTEVWYVPGRDARPSINKKDELIITPVENSEIENYCSFCNNNYYETTPEKCRIVYSNNQYFYKSRLNAEELYNEIASFRRIGNLFEIVTFDYWKTNYGYKLSNKNQEWKEKYLSTEKGKQHIKKILEYKLKSAGKNEDEIKKSLNDEECFNKLCNPFFGGCHELIIPERHYYPKAKDNTDLCSSGELSLEKHFHYFKFTIEAILDILRNNRFVRYVTVFQNWLSPAGASFDHLHRQIVGLDEWGTTIERQIIELRKNRNIYNEYGPNFALYHDLIFAENDYAVAFADYGHRYPTVAIYSKSVNPRPWEHTDEEIKGVSDLVHAIHKAMGNDLACNEEWYYTPIDAVDVMPWHIMIKWRTVTPAGFEGGTKIYINPISSIQVRDFLVPKLFQLRAERKISNISIAEECSVQYNMLQYYKYQR